MNFASTLNVQTCKGKDETLTIELIKWEDKVIPNSISSKDPKSKRRTKMQECEKFNIDVRVQELNKSESKGLLTLKLLGPFKTCPFMTLNT